ncbi:IS701 family transposase [Microbispora hainanensis]|uniref:IS701 family transposase n=1 Tax=Microbispora hainanensis TaxID=568844 RepID=A0A544YSJ9_9ACTN|nr:IS701 family transposase [Microbispora hainanensis]TQS19749.1 IS701 family transposase [Microbispora hainanensis]
MFDELTDRIGNRFSRVEPRRRVRALLGGLLSELPRKNCWTLAEHAGDRTPDGMQHLLSRAVWDADAVRDDLRGYVVEHLGHDGAVLVVDETGDLKKGTGTVGVQRQYTGTAGRIENSQVAVFLAYSTPAGHAFIDRELYLPQAWTGDADRCGRAGVPQDRQFATKGELATRMVARALDAEVEARWVTGDEVYGQSPHLRAELEARKVGYVLAVASSHRVTTGAGACRADQVIFLVAQASWQRLSAGTGAKGYRYYDWALVEIDRERPGRHWLLIRRNRRTSELAFYRCYAPVPVPLAVLVMVAGRRWTIEESFQTGKGLTGLDEHQVRRWTSWYRWTTLAMLAHAFLAAVTAHQRADQPAEHELAPMTLGETRRLLVRMLVQTAHSMTDLLQWSRWRRRHQARARASHYRRQALYEP